MFRLAFITLILTVFFQSMANASDEKAVFSGTLHFSGAVAQGSCAIDAESLQQTISMNEIKATAFSGPGAWASPTTFWIKLENCDPSSSQSASVAFTGMTDTADPQVYKVGAGATAAQGVGLGIFDSNDKLLVPNVAPEAATPLSEGQTVLFFTARYRSVSTKVISGDASAVINFSVIYQ